MLITKEIPVIWNSRNRKRYEKKGYKFTFIGDTFLMDVNDLSNGCDKRVDVKCDICGDVKSIAWNKYLKQHDDKFGDVCKKCRYVKIQNTVLKRYGIQNVFQLDEVKSKTKHTLNKKYGADNPMHVDKIKEKQQQSLFNSFGVYNPSQSDEIKQKKINTCLENYGVKNPMDDMALRIKAVQSQRESYKQNNGSVSMSKVEMKMCDILIELFGIEHCKPCAELDLYTLDCLLTVNDSKIDVEYDGQYWHNLDNQSEKDKIRDNYMYEHGYKVLRIKGNRKVPTKEQLQEAVDYLVKGNHNYTEIILDI